MPKHWCYVFLCSDNFIYVGETTRLYRRFWEHENHKTMTTSIHRPVKLLGLYNISHNLAFLEYDKTVNKIWFDTSSIDEWQYNKTFFQKRRLRDNWDTLCQKLISLRCCRCRENGKDFETYLTERYMIEHGYDSIRGGRHVQVNLTRPASLDVYVKDRPLCKCNQPCEIKLSSNNNLYFVCSLYNVWDDFREHDFEIEMPQPCGYRELYSGDYELQKLNDIQFESKKRIRKRILSDCLFEG